MSKIDPELKKKLLKESQTPFKGLRRILWIAFSGSAFLGLIIMLSRIASGTELQQNNLLIQLAMEGLLEPDLVEESLGQAEVRATFAVGKGAIAGCYIQNGKLQRNCSLRVVRSDKVIFEGNLDSLKRAKDDIKEVNTGFECGVGCDKFSSWIEGDLIEAFKFVTKKRTLSQ